MKDVGENARSTANGPQTDALRAGAVAGGGLLRDDDRPLRDRGDAPRAESVSGAMPSDGLLADESTERAAHAHVPASDNIAREPGQQSVGTSDDAWLTVVGIGDDGYAGLGEAARRALADARVIVGGERHLAMLPRELAAERLPWPQPFDVAPLVARRPAPACVLASGDPMCFGVGATLARSVPAGELRVLSAPSSLSLAAARLGWALQDADAVSLVGRPLASLQRYLQPGRRVFVLSADGATPAALAAWLVAHRFGASGMTVFEHLGGPRERRIDALAHAWHAPRVADLNLVALEPRPDEGTTALPLTPGLPDDAYRHDGQLTKRDLRALTLARLAPVPGELLWDVGAGAGSIGIEWMRAHPSCRAIAIEAHPVRQQFIAYNRDALGVPSLALVAGRAPDALAGLAAPHAVFIGGGASEPGVLDACWAALKPGGRLVANAVTLQGEAVLVGWRAAHGGTLTRVSVEHAASLGGFDAWRPALPVTVYEAHKPHDAAAQRA